MYDGLMRLSLPEDVRLVSLVDYVVVIVAKSLEEVINFFVMR